MHGTVDYLIRGGVACLLCGCAALDTRPPEVRQPTNTVLVPVPVPCFAEPQRPTMPARTVIDPATATTEQLAAAELADAIAFADYARQVDDLFSKCTQPPGAIPK